MVNPNEPLDRLLQIVVKSIKHFGEEECKPVQSAIHSLQIMLCPALTVRLT
jgi:hypothetical protein